MNSGVPASGGEHEPPAAKHGSRYYLAWSIASLLIGGGVGLAALFLLVGLKICIQLFLGVGANAPPPAPPGYQITVPAVEQLSFSGLVRAPAALGLWTIPIATTLGGFLSGLVLVRR